MQNTNEQNTRKSSFQSQSLGPNKVAAVETPIVTVPETKPEQTTGEKTDVTPEVPTVVPEVGTQVTDKPVPQIADKPVTSKPMLEKAS
jgi:hypothetical protein